MMEITSGLYRVDNVRGANSYLAIFNDNVLVIDTGMPGNANKIINCLTKVGKKPDDVRYIILTHADMDHSGSVADLKEITGAKVAIHTKDAPAVSGKRVLKEVKGILSPIFAIMPKIIKFRTIEPDILLNDGNEIGGLRVIYTPGHTIGHISLLYQPRNLLFAGDALRSDLNGNILPMSRSMTLDMDEAWISLRKIAELDFDILRPRHGAPVVGNASKKVKSLLKND